MVVSYLPFSILPATNLSPPSKTSKSISVSEFSSVSFHTFLTVSLFVARYFISGILNFITGPLSDV